MQKHSPSTQNKASWRRMFVAQPPVKRMDMIKTSGWQTSSSITERKLLIHDKLKMGTLYDIIEEEAYLGDYFDSMSYNIPWCMFSAQEVVPKMDNFNNITEVNHSVHYAAPH
jgi:hypothetical protein